MLLLENSRTSHWFLVKDVSKLLCRKSSNCKEKYYCLRCFRGFTKKSGLEDHDKDCSKFKPQRVIMPQDVKQRDKGCKPKSKEDYEKEQLTFKFNSYRKTIKHPFTIVADTECILEPKEDADESDATTVKTAVHIPCTASYLLSSHLPGYENEQVQVFHGTGCIDEFL